MNLTKLNIDNNETFISRDDSIIFFSYDGYKFGNPIHSNTINKAYLIYELYDGIISVPIDIISIFNDTYPLRTTLSYYTTIKIKFEAVFDEQFNESGNNIRIYDINNSNLDEIIVNSNSSKLDIYFKCTDKILDRYNKIKKLRKTNSF